MNLKKQKDSIEKYLEQLQHHLRHIKESEREDILRDQEELIRDAVSSGRAPEEVLNSLGTAKSMARNLILELKMDSIETADTTSQKIKSIFGILLALCILAPFNIILLFVPAIVIFTLMATGWGITLGFVGAGFGLLLQFFTQLIFVSVGLTTHLALLFLMLSILGSGILVGVVMTFISIWIAKLLYMYLKWNVGLVKGRAV